MNRHGLTTYLTFSGWSWSCRCGKESRTSGSPTQTAAYSHGERHIRSAIRKEQEEK